MNADMLDFERRKTSHSILPPDFCPICKRTGDPEYICGREIGIQELIFRDYVTPLQTVFRCRSRECRNMFFAFYNSSTN